MESEARKIIQISSAGIKNTAKTQTNYLLTALCNDGTVWCIDDDFSIWRKIIDIPEYDID